MRVIVTRSGLFGRLARWLGLEWSHAALLYCDDSFLDWRVIEASALGIRECPLEEFMIDVEQYLVLHLKETPPQQTYAEILAYAWGNVGKPYSYWWLLKIAWKLVKRHFVGIFRFPAHVCSSLVYDAFLYGDIDLVPPIPGGHGVLVLPDDLANSPLLEAVIYFHE